MFLSGIVNVLNLGSLLGIGCFFENGGKVNGI